jgi:hypothetical protein
MQNKEGIVKIRRYNNTMPASVEVSLKGTGMKFKLASALIRLLQTQKNKDYK